MSFPLLTFGCLGVGGVYMSWSDLTRRRLPNTAAAILALAGLLGGGLMLGTQHAFSSLLHLLIALGIGICAFALNLVGSGDAKYYAAAAGWFPLSEAFRLLGWVALIGFVIAALWLVGLRFGPSHASDDSDFDKVPFGLAIAAGSVLASAGLIR